MGSHPDDVRRRLVPDDAQVQIILGSLLGGAAILGSEGSRSLRVSHPLARSSYVWWKYERLITITRHAPTREADALVFHSIPHPLFDDLAAAFVGAARRRARARVVRELLAPLGLAVWMTDAGRLELRAEVFVPTQRRLALCA